MTACRNKARGAVVAALAGALTLGAAPVMALADGAQMMATSSQDAFSAGKVSAQDGKGGDVTFPEKDLVSFTTSSGQYLLPTSINVNGTDYELDLKSGTGNALVEYFEGVYDADNPVASGTSPVAAVGKGFIGNVTTALAKNYEWQAGETYTARITYKDADSQYNEKAAYVSFKVVDADLADAVVFNATGDNTDASVTGMTYTGQPIKVGLAVDGAVVDLGDYTLTVYKSGQDKPVSTSDADEDKEATVTDAGDYIAYLDNAIGERVKTMSFSVAKLDLSKADVTLPDRRLNDQSALNSSMVKVNGLSLPDTVTGALTVTAYADYNDAGDFVATVKPTNSNDPNITGAATVHFAVVEGTYYVKSDFTYDDTQFASIDLTGEDGSYDEDEAVEVDLSAGQYFDVEKIKVGALKWDDDLVDIAYSNVAGEAVDASELDTPGTYYVTVRVNAERSGWTAGSDTNTFAVRVTGGTIEGENVTFTFGGEVTDDVEVTYDGSDFMEKIASTVKVGKKTLAQGTDYELVILDGSGKRVDGIVNADDYTVEVQSDTYDVDNTSSGKCSMEITVKAIDLKYLYAESDLMRDFGGRVILPYTGEDIDAGFEFAYYTKGGEVVAKGTEGATRNVLPEGAVAVDGIKYLEEENESTTSGTTTTWGFNWDATSTSDSITEVAKVVDALNAEGFYNLYVTVDPEVSVNYKYGTGADGIALTDLVEVSDAKVFVDVDSSAYYAESVYQANAEGYIFGMNNSDVFAPDKSMSRAEMVCVLYRMAGGTTGEDDSVGGDWDDSFITDYTDVDPKGFYAEALAWATKAGIVTGYEDGRFGPSDDVTVEQYVTMLARYAEVKGDYEAVDADAVLAGVADGSLVSEFGQDAVAWAIENEYLAQGGADIQPQSPVSRGRAVTIAVRYQPEQADIIAPRG